MKLKKMLKSPSGLFFMEHKKTDKNSSQLLVCNAIALTSKIFIRD
jgi:hypothetical protein